MMKKKLTYLTVLLNIFFFNHTSFAAEKICSAGATITQVQYNDIVNCSIEKLGDVDTFALTAKKGDFVNVSVTITEEDCDTGYSLYIRAFDGENQQLTRDSTYSCGGTNIEFTADESGIYTIVLGEFSNDDTGHYQLAVQCISGSCVSNALLVKKECTSTFDGAKLSVPLLDYGNKDYWVNFHVISSNPIQVQLTDFGEK
jgi:hypothetical protein